MKEFIALPHLSLSSPWSTTVRSLSSSRILGTQTVRGVVNHIREDTEGDVEPARADRWMEANDVKYLFESSQSWNRKDARDFADAVWNYLELTN